MAVLKSIILFVLFIHWVKAAQFQNDIESEFNRIFHQIRQTMDNTWRWMRDAANKNYLRINEIFTAKKAIEEGRHKYQDVLAPSEAPHKPDNTQIQSETASVPLITNPATPKLITVVSSAAPESPSSSQEITNPVQQPESANLQKTDENEPETDTTKVPEQPTETEPEPECEDDTHTEEPATVTKVDAETQTEPQIPLEGEPNTNKLESPVVHDIPADSPAVEEVPESDDKKVFEPITVKEETEVIVADPPEHIEFEMKRGLSRSIYEQQNIIILFLFFLIIIMSAYFFLLSRTPHTCPTIVIGELGSNLKSGMHNIKK